MQNDVQSRFYFHLICDDPLLLILPRKMNILLPLQINVLLGFFPVTCCKLYLLCQSFFQLPGEKSSLPFDLQSGPSRRHSKINFFMAEKFWVVRWQSVFFDPIKHVKLYQHRNSNGELESQIKLANFFSLEMLSSKIVSEGSHVCQDERLFWKKA